MERSGKIAHPFPIWSPPLPEGSPQDAPHRPSRTETALPALGNRRHLAAFIAGCILVTAGVLLHLPMYWMGRFDGFRLADMPMDTEMLWGMAAILAGVGVAAYGL